MIQASMYANEDAHDTSGSCAGVAARERRSCSAKHSYYAFVISLSFVFPSVASPRGRGNCRNRAAVACLTRSRSFLLVRVCRMCRWGLLLQVRLERRFSEPWSVVQAGAVEEVRARSMLINSPKSIGRTPFINCGGQLTRMLPRQALLPIFCCRVARADSCRANLSASRWGPLAQRRAAATSRLRSRCCSIQWRSSAVSSLRPQLQWTTKVLH